MEQCPDPVTRALTQPHIVQSICEYLPRASLATAARVSRLWYLPAMERKWEKAPLSALRERVLPSRRQLYASKMRDLIVPEGATRLHRAAFRSVAFDGLKSLSLKCYMCQSDAGGAVIERYLPPTLETLILRGCSLEDSFFVHLAAGCHRVRRLIISLSVLSFSGDALARFMAVCPALEELQLEHFDDTNMMTAMLGVQCARQPNLRFLNLPPMMEISADHFEAIVAQVPNPFPCLERVLGCVPSMALPLLGQWFGKVFELVLNIEDSETQFLEAIARMTALKRVRARFPGECKFTKAEMRSLYSLSRLEDFSLCSSLSEAGYISKMPLSAMEFSEWISHFPGLRLFEVKLEFGDIGQAFVDLGRHCPKLETCSWPTPINFSHLDLDKRPTPLFPNLAVLQVPVARTCMDRPDLFPLNAKFEQSAVTKVIHAQFPKLYRFNTEIKTGDVGVEAIRNAIWSFSDENRPKDAGFTL